MPIRTISWHGVSWGILSIDTDNMEFDEWRTEHLEIMALAAKKLDIIGRDNCFAGHSNSRFDSWKEAARAFLGNDLPEVGVLCPNIMLDHKDGEMKPLVKAKRSHDAPTDCASSPVWIEMEGAKDIRWTADGHFLMDLWYGAFRTRLKLVGKIQRPEWVLSDSDYTQHMSIKMADVTHLWNRFVCTRVGPGTKPLFHLTFKDSPELEADGIRLWKEEIRLGVNLFGRTPINL